MTRQRSEQARSDFDAFVTRSGADLLRTAYLLVWDLSEAEDLVQECLLKVAKRWPRVRTMDHPLAYAKRILVNLALGGSTRRTRQRLELGAEADTTLPDLGSAAELVWIDTRDELLDALGALPAHQRAVLVLRYFEDLPEADVAELLNCSVGTVKSAASRGLTRLRAELGRRPSNPSHTPCELLGQRSTPW